MQHELLGGVGGYQVSEMYREASEDHVLLVVDELWLLLLSAKEHAQHEMLFHAPDISTVSHASCLIEASI